MNKRKSTKNDNFRAQRELSIESSRESKRVARTFVRKLGSEATFRAKVTGDWSNKRLLSKVARLIREDYYIESC
jgi:hypothetical protein